MSLPRSLRYRFISRNHPYKSRGVDPQLTSFVVSTITEVICQAIPDQRVEVLHGIALIMK